MREDHEVTQGSSKRELLAGVGLDSLAGLTKVGGRNPPTTQVLWHHHHLPAIFTLAPTIHLEHHSL